MLRQLGIYILIISACATLATAQEVTTAEQNVSWTTKYSKARRSSSETNLPVMLFLTMDGCFHCTRMENDSFKDQGMISNLNHSFIPAKVKTDMQSRLARGLKVNIFPTTVFIAPDGKILEYIRGYVPKHKLRLAMDRVMDASAASVASRPSP